MTPQPIDTAPAGDGWILGLVAGDGAPIAATQPWALLTRCDAGWEDDRGYARTPTAWVALPDPQPEPTGWKPAEGVVAVSAAWGENYVWRGWMVHIVRPDGSHDGDRDPFFLDSPAEALRIAERESRKLGLPIERGEMTHPDPKVIDFTAARRARSERGEQ